MRHTKIVATLGPATNSQQGIRDLVGAGVDVFRLNFSHGTQEAHREVIARIRQAATESGRSIAILQDLSGPKIRTGLLQDGAPIRLVAGETLRIAVGDFVGGPGRVSTSYADLPRAVRPGDPLLLDDGHIELRVEENDGQELRTIVVEGGMLGEHKGINAPGVTLPLGGYEHESARLGVTLAPQRPISGTLSVEHGALYNGHQTVLALTRGRTKLATQLSLEPSLSLNWVDVIQGQFTTTLAGSRITYTITPTMFVSALLQYNSGTNSLATNARLRWEYRPGSEFFVVYNEQRDTTGLGAGLGAPDLQNRAFIVKVNRSMRF